MGEKQNGPFSAFFEPFVEARFPEITRHFRWRPILVRELDERLGFGELIANI
jgi:hypothetical protein